jgi:8-oxo-dGTP pyrophosphatase MutT (NUDIX family)
MRRSLAALALIRHTTDSGETVWLLRWNQRWQAFSFVGGHREDGETFRACCVREVAEELGLHDDGDCRVDEQPLKHLEFTAWSQAAQEDTAYTFELFEVELRTLAARQQVAASPHNHWVTAAEVRAGRTGDGQPISPTVLRVLGQAGLLPPEPDEPVPFSFNPT